MPDPPDLQGSDATHGSSLVAWRLALAALEAEKARLMAKYNHRIAELQKAIKSLERDPAPKPSRPRASSAPQRKPARKKKPAG